MASAELDSLTAEVTNTNTVEESAIVLINGMAQQILDNVNDPAALTALATSLKDESAKLAAAVQANTPPVVTAKAATRK